MNTYEIWSTIIQSLVLIIMIIGVCVAFKKLTQYMKEKEDRFESEVKWRTEKAYEIYKVNPTLRKATKSVFEESKLGTDYANVKFDYNVATIVNYLESLAVGIDQKVYNEVMLKDYLKHTIIKATKVFLLNEDGDTNGRPWKTGRDRPMIKPKEQPFLMDLYKKWNTAEIKTEFKNKS